MAVPTNTPITTSLAIDEALASYVFAMPFTSSIKSYSDYFGDRIVKSNATGPTITVPKPPRVIAQGGRGVTSAAFAAQPIAQESAAITIDSYRRAHAEIETKDETLKFKKGESQWKVHWQDDLAYFTEQDALVEINKVGNVVLAGTSGLTYDDATIGMSLLAENGVGEADLHMLTPQLLMSKFTNNISSFFNSGTEGVDAFNKGYVGTVAGYKWSRSELLPIHANGTATDGAFDTATGLTPLGAVQTTSTNGDITIAINSIGTDGTITEGSVIYIDNVFAVHPITRQSYGYRKGYAVASTQTSSTNAVVLTLTEKFIDGSGAASQDVSWQNVSALPQSGAIVYYKGKVNTTYRQAVAYRKDAFGCASAKLVEPVNAPSAWKMLEGIGLRAIADYNSSDDANRYRFDNYNGYFTPRPEWAVRYWQES